MKDTLQMDLMRFGRAIRMADIDHARDMADVITVQIERLVERKIEEALKDQQWLAIEETPYEGS